jgi:2-methylcitrate dehydratase PrpD
LKTLIHKQPRTGLEGKFSMEYVVAAALLDRGVRLESFTDAAVQRPEAQEFLRKVETSEEGGEVLPARTTVEVELRNGEKRSIRVETLRGSYLQPLTDAEVEAKFRDCVSFSGMSMDVDGFLAAVWDWRDRPVRSILEFVPRRSK